jgi:hypothetical protein
MPTASSPVAGKKSIMPFNDKSPLPHDEEAGFYSKSVDSVC